jgi:oxygen-dependent protoporphyrinogen oxidase
VQRRFGGAVAAGLLGPFTRGVYGAAPERLGAADAFPRLVALERRRGSVLRGLLAARGGARRSVLLARDGTESVPRGVARALGGRVRLGASVEAVQPAQSGGPATVHLGTGEVVEAREVALALPATAQAALVSAPFPHVAEALAAIDYAPIVVAAVGFERAHGPALPDAFGFLRGPDAPTRILGATFNSRMRADVSPPGTELLTVFLGGTEDRGVLAQDDEALTRIVTRDLARALGGRLEPAFIDIWRWPRAIPVPAPGHRGRMAALAATLDRARIRLLGSHVTGVSLEDCCRPLAPMRRPLPEGLVRV